MPKRNDIIRTWGEFKAGEKVLYCDDPRPWTVVEAKRNSVPDGAIPLTKDPSKKPLYASIISIRKIKQA